MALRLSTGGLALALLSSAALPRASASGADYDVPEGFAVERACDHAESFLALAFDTRGRVFLAIEEGPILLASDRDGDRTFETVAVFTDELHSAHGLAWHVGDLYAVGTRGAEPGLFRITPAEDGERAARCELLLGFTDGGEHGAHSVAVGPDGALYVAIGNEARIVGEVERSPLSNGYEGSLLAPRTDPSGFGAGLRWPYGAILRYEPRAKSTTLFCAGLRNAYDLAFDARGELFTCDSDMEWDLGLPWYRPVRVLHCVRDGDFGARSGSNMWPAHYPDTLPDVVAIGRGSPTGVAFWTDPRAPDRFRGALLVADWSTARIHAVRLAESGATFSGELDTLLRANVPCSVTDLAPGPDGALYFTTGGRGLIGELLRLVRRSDEAKTKSDALDAGAAKTGATGVTTVPVAPATPAAIGAGDPRERRLACEALPQQSTDDPKTRDSLYALLGDDDRFVRWAARSALERGLADAALADLAARIATEPDPRRFLEGLFLLARADPTQLEADTAIARLARLLDEPAHADRAPELLRAIAVVAMRAGEPSPGLRGELASALLARLASAEPRAPIAELLAHWGPDGARAALLAALRSEPDRAQQIVYAWCAAVVAGDWTLAEARELLAWFEAAADGPRGAASYAGYLAAIRDEVLDRFGREQSLAIAEGSELGAPTLALFVARLRMRSPPALIARLKAQYAALGNEPAAERKRVATLHALGGDPAPEVRAWMRELAAGGGATRDAALSGLARTPEPGEVALFVAGVLEADPAAASDCIAALRALDVPPADARTWVRLLDGAHRLGRSRGAELLEWLARSAGREAPSASELAGPEGWQRALNTLEQWVRWKHPEAAALRAPREGVPHWSAEKILTFLTRSAARPGSAARGAQVFERAACASCHALAREGFEPQRALTAAPGSLGPDLSTAAKRFSEADLIEAIATPSRTIPDLYRAEIFVTRAEERIEGRVVAEDARTVSLLPIGAAGSDSSKLVVIDRAEIADRRPSEISPMPDGLLDALTLEEVKDLLAFLHDDEGTVHSADGEPAWLPLFSGRQRSGWKFDPAHWREEPGVIVGSTAGLEDPSWLVSKNAWGDFELEVDVRLGSGNSGLQYRSSIDPASGEPIGYQADIGEGHWGSLYATDGRGMLAEADPTHWRGAVDLAGWNHFYVRAEGDRHRIEINGVTTIDARDGAHASGVIAFQLHEGPKMEVRFANARIRALRAE